MPNSHEQIGILHFTFFRFPFMMFSEFCAPGTQNNYVTENDYGREERTHR